MGRNDRHSLTIRTDAARRSATGRRPAEQLKEEEFATIRKFSWRRAKPLRSLDGFATWPAAMIVEIG
jgi:hypothetical protein